MNWTTDRPKVPGVYWLKQAGPAPLVVSADVNRHDAADVTLYFFGTTETEWLPCRADEYAGALWCGPLVPPETPT